MNYYILKINSLVKTFSMIDVGCNFFFELTAQNANAIFTPIKQGDFIYGYVDSPIKSIKYIFEVNDVKSAKILVLIKKYETFNGVSIDNIELRAKILNCTNLLQIDKDIFDEIYQKFIKNAFNDKDFIIENHKNSLSNKKLIDIPYQRIFFGAPGTGKSYALKKEAELYFGDNYERVTFHPNYMYGNFVGTFKPYPKILKTKDGLIKKDEDGNIQETITYTYVPGIFIQLLIKAFRNPDINYLLIIEEINRVNIATVFGDIFQLLDRNEFGESEYSIVMPKDLQDFLNIEFYNYELSQDIQQKLGNNFNRLYIPSNFYIWATMNGADQGVMPMDTAFKRRWDFTYFGVNDIADVNKESFNKYKFKINANEIAKWDDFRRALNKKLSLLNVPEDKLIGPYFISKSSLENEDLDKLTRTIKSKVLMYLYDDVAKVFRSLLFTENKYYTYSDVCKYFDENALTLFKGNLNIDTESIEIDKDNNIDK